jgi:hypothetical protein
MSQEYPQFFKNIAILLANSLKTRIHSAPKTERKKTTPNSVGFTFQNSKGLSKTLSDALVSFVCLLFSCGVRCDLKLFGASVSLSSSSSSVFFLFQVVAIAGGLQARRRSLHRDHEVWRTSPAFVVVAFVCQS